MKKLLIFRSSTAIGGAERYVLQIIEEAANRGISVGLVTNDAELKDLAGSQAKTYLYDYAPEPFNKKRVLAYHLKYRSSQAKFRRIIKDFFEGNDGTIFCQSLSDKMIVAALEPRQRVVWIEHGLMVGTFFKFRPLIRRYATLANSSAVSSIICVSQATKDNIITAGVDEDKLQVVYNWTKKIICPAAREDGACRLITTSRLTELKGVQYLLEALGKIDVNLWRLTIVGDGDYRSELENLSRQFPSGQVEFVGHQGDVAKYLCGAGVFINPTVHPGEGLPISNIEALSAGLPVVTSTYGGAKETVIDGQSGLLVDPKKIEEFRAKLSGLISDKERRERMSVEAAKDWEGRFNSEINLAKTYKILFAHES